MNAFDTHCNRRLDFILHIVKNVTDKIKPIAEFEANWGETSKALAYLLPQNKFDIINEDEYVLSLAERELQNLSKERTLSNRISFFPWNIEYPLSSKNYHVGFSENYFDCINYDKIAPIWENMNQVCEKHFHLITLSKTRDTSFYYDALRNGNPPVKKFRFIHLDPLTDQAILQKT